MSLISSVRHRRRSLAAVSLVVVAGSTLLVSPVSAATPPTSDYGNTVKCYYRAPGSGPAYEFRLKSFTVTAPKVYAKSGTQKVGWKFFVTRSMNWGGGPTKVTYTSPVQKASATTTTAAAFTAKSVDVALPAVENYTSVWYTVTLKLFWYAPDGSVQSKVVYQMPYMKWIENGKYWGDWDNICQAGFYQGP